MLLTNRRRSFASVIRDATEGTTAVSIASAYVSPGGLEALNLLELSGEVPVRVIVGRAEADGLFQPTLRYLLAFHQRAAGNGGGVRVARPAAHSKIYLVRHGQRDQIWVGSSNLSDNGMGAWIEANTSVADPDTAREVVEELELMWAAGIPVDRADIPVIRPSSRRMIRRGAREEEGDVSLAPETGADGSPGITISVLGADGEVQPKNGLNYWRAKPRKEGADRSDEACIVLRAEHIDELDAGEVFGSTETGTTFEARTHDLETFPMMIQGTGTLRGGRVQGKQIASEGGWRLFGRWLLRTQLQLDYGTPVTREVLEAYGRTDIDFHRIGTNAAGEAIVLVDFSPPADDG